MEPNKRSSVVRFGTYEADLDSGELRKGGAKIRLQQQPFKVLEALLERPGAVVTREELRARIWPQESFGDFDQAVNVAVAKLRTALGDTAENPRFIETLPRRGYRFVAPVREEPGAQSAAALVTPDPAAEDVLGHAGQERSARRRKLAGAILGALIVLGVATALLVHRRQFDLEFSRVSFGKGAIRSARFTVDGHGLVYGAAWNGKPSQVFWAQPETPEARPYTMPDADILAVSPTGEMAVLLNRRAGVGWISRGTLALMPLTGNAPREILDNVQDADWDHGGQRLGIVRWAQNHCRLEYPIGRVLQDTAGGHWMSDIRIAPRGDLIAFLDHPLEGDDAGRIAVVDLAGRQRMLTGAWVSLRGLAWDPAGDALWFTGNEVELGRERPRAIYRVSLNGIVQKMFHETGDLTLHDISRDRRLLVSRDTERYEVMGRFGSEVRDLSWLDFSRGDDLSADGRSVLMTVEGEAAGRNYEVYMRPTDGSPPMKLGEGYGGAISPDGQWALAVAPFGVGASPTPQLILLPVGKGQPRVLTQDAMTHLSGAWFPNGQRILFKGSEPGREVRDWVQDLGGGKPTPVTPEGVSGTLLSPDGQRLCAVDADGKMAIYAVAGGNPMAVAGVEAGDAPVRWSQDGHSLFVARTEHLPISVYRVELASGHRQPVQELAPRDVTGIIPDISSVFATPDGGSLVYSYFRLQSDLYVAAPK